MYFKSKKDLSLAFIIWSVSILMGWLMIVEKSVLVYMTSPLTIGLLLSLWFGTSYKIEGAFLKIKSGPFRSTVPIAEIKSLTTSKTMQAGPALSMDRIEIMHGKYKVAVVSPKNKNEFAQALLSQNQQIKVDKNLLNAVKN